MSPSNLTFPNDHLLPAPAPHLYWYILASLLTILTILHFLNLLRRRFSGLGLFVSVRLETTPSPHSLISHESTGSTPSLTSFTWSRRHEQLFIELPMPDRKLSTWVRLGKVVSTFTKKYFTLVCLQVWFAEKYLFTWYFAEFVWVICYSAGVICLSLYGTSWDPSIWANQSGMVAVAQVPLLMALSGKNNLITLLTGYSYERLQFFARWISRTILAGVWIHISGHLYLAKGRSHIDWQSPMAILGMTGAVSMTLFVVIGLRPVRRYLYEFFVVAHFLLGIITIVAFIIHWNAIAIWIYPGIGLLVLDAFIRLARLILLNRLWTRRQNHLAQLSSVTPSTLLLSVPAPSFTWVPGQHFYLNLPSISTLPWESHPFTAATLPSEYDDGELKFIIRVRKGFTRRLKDKLDDVRKLRGLRSLEACEIEIKANVEGPYGLVPDLTIYDSVVLVAGGAGISFAISQLLSIVAKAKSGQGNVRMLRLVWMVRSPEHVSWIAPVLASSFLDLPPTLKISLHIHNTTPPVSTSPDQLDLDELYWSHHVPLRSSSIKQSNLFRRLLSAVSWRKSDTAWSGLTGWGGANDTSATSSDATLVSSPARVKQRPGMVEIEKISHPFQPDLESGANGLLGDSLPINHPFNSPSPRRDVPISSLLRSGGIGGTRRPSPPTLSPTSDTTLTPTPLALTLDSWAARHLPPGRPRSMSHGSSSSGASFYSVGTNQTPPPRLGSPRPTLPPILSPFVVWHDGRANLDEALADTLASMGLGCKLVVSACGPGPLIDGTRSATRRALTVGGAWRGEVDIDFHSESFGL